MKIALGTISTTKFEFVKEVLNEIGITATLEPLEVLSGIADQPITDKETKQGSINRAKNAIELSKDADFALGIEVGYHPDKNQNYEMFCWATLVDRKGKQLSARSYKILLPEFHQQILKENKYLGDFVRQYLAENSDSVSQHIGIIIRDRKPLVQTAVKLVLFKYFIK